MIKKLIYFSLILLSVGCNRYYTPEKYANPKCEFEKGQRRYEKKMMRRERQNNNIDPLKWN
jgi:hypothetical protein